MPYRREDWETTKPTQRGVNEVPWLNDPEFLRLQKEWEAKLNDTPGCRNIDPFDGRGFMHHHVIHTKKAAVRGEATGEAELWRIRSAWTQHARFRTPAHRFLWIQWTAGDANAKYVYEHSTIRPPFASLRAFRAWLLTETTAALAWHNSERHE